MSELSPRARALFGAARRSSHPTDADRERVWNAVSAAVAALPAEPPPSTPATGSSAAGSGLPSTLLAHVGAKAALAVVVVGAVGAIGSAVWFARVLTAPRPIASPPVAQASSQTHNPPDKESTVAGRTAAARTGELPEASVNLIPPASATVPAPSPRPLLEAAVHVAVQRAPTAAASAVRGPTILPARRKEPDGRETSQARSHPAALPAAASPGGDLDSGEGSPLGAELRLVRDAQLALRGADPARALALLDKHARRHPEGMLASERDIARVRALCDLGRRDEARRAAAEASRRRTGLAEALRADDPCAGR